MCIGSKCGVPLCRTICERIQYPPDGSSHSSKRSDSSGSTHCEIKVLDVTDRAASLLGNKVQESWGVPLVHVVFVELFGRENLHVDAKYCCESIGVSQASAYAARTGPRRGAGWVRAGSARARCVSLLMVKLARSVALCRWMHRFGTRITGLLQWISLRANPPSAVFTMTQPATLSSRSNPGPSSPQQHVRKHPASQVTPGSQRVSAAHRCARGRRRSTRRRAASTRRPCRPSSRPASP